MSQKLEYSTLPHPKPKPRWIGAPITIGVVISGFALLVCLGYRDQGLMSGERFAIWFGLVVCFICLLLASLNLRRDTSSNGSGVGSVVCTVAILLGFMLIVCTMVAYFHIFGS